jgi:hypothetical protein
VRALSRATLPMRSDTFELERDRAAGDRVERKVMLRKSAQLTRRGMSSLRIMVCKRAYVTRARNRSMPFGQWAVSPLGKHGPPVLHPPRLGSVRVLEPPRLTNSGQLLLR